ncbi:MAG: hypothetical protein SFY95_08300 [Planctomycetota bacterium]|nr:hypothetical protein [Planctomycetota bacterium]
MRMSNGGDAWPWRAHKRLADAPTQGLAERSVLQAALAWANREGELCVGNKRWAALAGVDPRTLRRTLAEWAERGIIQDLGPDPKYGNTRRRRIPFLVDRAEGEGGVVEPAPRTFTPEAPGTTSGGGGHSTPQTTKKQPLNDQQQQGAAADVFSRLGIDPSLRGHANATPERLAWIEREAPAKRNPGGWAAQCIRAGWDVPAPTGADAKAASKAKWDAIRERFNAMPDAEREALVARARVVNPNLDSAEQYPSDSPAILGAVAKLAGWNTKGAVDSRGQGN